MHLKGSDSKSGGIRDAHLGGGGGNYGLSSKALHLGFWGLLSFIDWFGTFPFIKEGNKDDKLII